MKKFGTLLAGIFVLTLIFSFTTGIGIVYAQTTWTASNVKGTFELTRIVTKKSVQTFQVLPLTLNAGSFIGFTDSTTGDPTIGTVPSSFIPPGLIGTPSDSCFLAISGEIFYKNKEEAVVYICIDDVIPLIVTSANGKTRSGYVIGTGEVWTSLGTGAGEQIGFFEVTWYEKDVGGLPTSITISAGKMVGGHGAETEEDSNFLLSATLPTVTVSQ